MNTMSLSAYVYGCTPDAAPAVLPPEPSVSDFLPPTIDRLTDQIIGDQLANNDHMVYDYTRRDIDVIVGGQF